MNKYMWTMSMFLLGIGIYAWTIEAKEPLLIKLVCAEAGSFALFCAAMAVLHDMMDTRH